MKWTLILIIILLANSAFSQGRRSVVFEDSSFKNGKTKYDEDKYEEAIPYFQETIKNDPANQDSHYYLGLCFSYTDQPKQAIEEFKTLKKLNADYWPWFYYEAGVAYSELNMFDEAIEMLEEFERRYANESSKTNAHHKAKYRIRYAKEQKALQSAKTNMKNPVRLSDNINSSFNDYAPVIDPTGTKLYFTSVRLGGISLEDAGAEKGDEDIYFIEKINGIWSKPKLMPEPINTDKMEGIDFISADGQLIGFTSSRDGGIGSSDIYLSTLEGTQWSAQVNIGNVVNSEAWDSNSTISYDGNRIIFASQRSNGYGGSDLYMVEKNIFGDWGPAMNLGGIVNTPLSENAPFLSQDGKTLYFSSEGHPGYGSYDIFKTIFENGKWSAPLNLGKPLNTPGRDDYFTIGGSGEVGYLSAYDSNGKNSDLYEVEIPEEMRPAPTVVVEGLVTNARTKALLGAYVMVEDVNSGELIVVNKSNSATGKYLVVLPAGKTYSVSANKEGFFFHSELFDVPVSAKFQTIKKDIELNPIEKGAKIVINNIFFETGKATLSPQSNIELEKAVDLLKTNPSMIIEVGGHTDNVGDDAYNMKLSHDRAKSVREFLVKAGIAGERVQAKGYGESNAIATNDTEDGRKANRRTEFVILEF